jgi:hypothetical protein
MADTAPWKNMVVPLTAFVAGAARTVIHGVLGCAVIGALVIEVIAVRSRRAPGWFLPVAGGLLFALLIAALLTSTVWYIGNEDWPLSAGYS